jgi:hypothetical protein
MLARHGAHKLNWDNGKGVSLMKLLDQVRDKIRKKHYSIRTEQAYVECIRRFIIFYGKRHPKDLGEDEISQYISYLASELKVSASTQNQVLSAIVFRYKLVPGFDGGESVRSPSVMTVVLRKVLTLDATNTVG